MCSTKNISQSGATPVATTSDNRLWNCPIVRLITSLPICSQQVCTTSFRCCLKCNDDGKQAVGVLPRWNSLLDLSLGYSAANFLVPQNLVHEDALVNGRVFIFTSTTSVMTSRRILITEEYLNAHFFSVFLFVWVLQVLKELIFSCKFS